MGTARFSRTSPTAPRAARTPKVFLQRCATRKKKPRGKISENRAATQGQHTWGGTARQRSPYTPPRMTASHPQRLQGTSMSNDTTSVRYGSIAVDGLNIAYREAGNPANPKLVLLHGFPASSHQYRDLIRVLADSFHLIAPDYPGFGLSDIPDPATFSYTFDRIAQIIGRFLAIKGFDSYGLFVQDYGGPVGFRLITNAPNALEWLIVQNSNAYEVGFTAAWD